MNANLIISVILIVAVVFALRSIIKKRKNGGCCGCSGCSGGCDSCECGGKFNQNKS